MKRAKSPLTRGYSAIRSFAITPHDTNPVNPHTNGYGPIAIRIGETGGALVGSLIGDNGVDQIYFVTPGETIVHEFEFIRDTGTDATGILGLY